MRTAEGATKNWAPDYAGGYCPVLWDTMCANKLTVSAALCDTPEEAVRSVGSDCQRLPTQLWGTGC